MAKDKDGAGRMKTSKLSRNKRGKTLLRVRVRLCECRPPDECHAGHWTEPMDARRIDRFDVKITQPDPVWFGAVLCKSEYRFV